MFYIFNKYFGRVWKNKLIFYLLFILVLVFFLSSLYFVFNIDEEFTMGLIRHNYKNIINIDRLDVHPPLYYLLLKLFLQITTFWSNSIFIKVIFARFFSIIIGIIGFYFLHKIIKKCGIDLNWKFQLIFYLLIPSIMSYLTVIRMYELASLFIIIEFYELLISFDNNNNNLNIFLSVIFAVLASYTHYYAAVSAGILLFTFFITSIFYNKMNSIKYFLSGIFYFILYLPIIFFVRNQFKYASSIKQGYSDLFHQIFGSFVGIAHSNGIFRLIFVFFILLGFIYLIIWSFRNINNKFNILFINILINLLFTILFAVFMNIIMGTPFSVRYTYPIFSIYAFFIISIFCLIVKMYFKNKNNLNIVIKVLLIFMSCFILFSTIKLIKTNLFIFDKSSISLIYNMKRWRSRPNKNINVYLNYYSNTSQCSLPLYVTQYSVYLKSINKNVYINKKDLNSVRKGTLAHNNKKLFEKVFDNTVVN